jgi:hypothetical protein
MVSQIFAMVSLNAMVSEIFAMVSQGFLQHRQEIEAVQTPLVQGTLVFLKLLF